MVVAMLADRGHLRYDQKISEIWPAFAQNGKENITVAELMRHECGVSFTRNLPLLVVDGIYLPLLVVDGIYLGQLACDYSWRTSTRR